MAIGIFDSAFRPRQPLQRLPPQAYDPSQWSDASPDAQAIMELASTPWDQPIPEHLRAPGFTVPQSLGPQQTPGRVPLQLSPEEAALIDAQAGIGPPMAMRDPRNPRAGGLPIGIMQQPQPQPSEEDLLAARSAVENVRAMSPGGLTEIAGPGMTDTPAARARRYIGIRNNPTRQASIAANQQLSELLASGAITPDQVRDPNSPYYTPPVHVTNSANSRTPDQAREMERKNIAYRQGLKDKRAQGQANVNAKNAQRGLSPQQRFAMQMMGGGEMNPMAIGMFTGDPRAAQVALEMNKQRAAEGAMGEERAFRQQQLANDDRRIGIQERQADAGIAAQQARAQREQDEVYRNAYSSTALANPMLQPEDIAREVQRVLPPGSLPTPSLGSGAATVADVPAMIKDMENLASDAFFAKYLDALVADSGLAQRYFPQIQQRYGTGVEESLADMPWFDIETARKRNELAGLWGMPQVSRPAFDGLGYHFRTPDNYRPEQEVGTIDWLMSLLR